jgi:16S rRNA (uracil1498-N3)-methyltransferase
MHKFFVAKENIMDEIARITGEDVKHIYKVLRLSIGDVVNINDGEGTEYLGEILQIDKNRVDIKLNEKIELNNESLINITLFQGLPKSSKMDLIVQKATELGVKKITPIITDRVIVKSELGEFKKTDRWKRIALESCKQSKRSIIPEVCTPIEFEKLLVEIKDMDLIVVPYENEDGFGIKNMLRNINRDEIRSIAIIIGPEGGFETKEIDTLRGLGAHIVTLGSRILRTETAGFVTASILMYELSDMGGK